LIQFNRAPGFLFLFNIQFRLKDESIMAHSYRLPAFVIACFAACVIGLFVVDTLVSLGLAARMVAPSDLIGSPRDFMGLLLAETQIAAVITIAALIGGALLGLSSKRRVSRKEFVPLLLGGFSGLIAASRLYLLRAASNPQCVVAGFVCALMVWLGFRYFFKKRSDIRWSFADVTKYAVYTGLTTGFLGNVVGQVLKGRTVDTLDMVFGSLAIVMALGFFLDPPLVIRRLLSWLPVILSFWLAGWFLLDSQRFGQENDRIVQSMSAARPPIILIVLDTVRADHLQQFGYSRNTMPALERWSEKALVAKRAVSPAGWTSPAHASVLSGRTVSLHGVHYTGNRESFRSRPVEGIDWLPQILADQGYFCIGVTANRLALPGEPIGFHRVLTPTHDRFDATLGSLVDRKFPLFRRTSEGLRWRIPYVDAEEIADIAMRAVPDGGQPLFLFVNFLDAHSPYNPPQEALDFLGIRTGNVFPRYSKHRWLTRNWQTFGEGKIQYVNDLYDGELRWIDTHLSRLLQWLDARYSDEAVIIVISDHGEELGEEGRVGHEYGLSQSLIHVPLMVRSPWLGAGPIDEVTDLRRLYPYILSCAAGQRPDASVLTTSDEFGIVSERYVSWSNVNSLGPAYSRDWVSIIDDGLKGIGPSEHQLELFEIGESAFIEQRPIDDAEKAEQLRARIDSYWETYSDQRYHGDVLSDADVERLRALGYIQ
jgi:arylsulfatase A-like enzyme